MLPPPPSPPPRRRLWLLGLPVLIALLWLGRTASHKPQQLQQALHEFRGDTSADTGTDVGPNNPMASALKVRQFLFLHPGTKLTLAQSATLVRMVNSPVNDLSQSEALDVLSLAQRADALSPAQVQQAQQATLRVLSRTPGAMVRLEGARFLGHLGNPQGASALTVLGHDDDPKVRQAAGQALARLPKPTP